MNKAFPGRWLDLADLGCVVLAILLLELFPRLGGWPLLVGILPWLVRLATRRSPVQTTPFDAALVIFLLTAAVGVWAAYQPQIAWTKFWLLISAVLLYFAIARQPVENLWWFAGFLVLIGISIVLIYLFARNWETHPAKLPFVNELMLGWMKIRPSFHPVLSHPNEDDAAGIAALILPFLIAFGWKFWQRRNRIFLFGSAAALFLMLFLLMITTSRSAWFAVGAALASFVLWIVVKTIITSNGTRARGIFISALAFLGILLVITLLKFPSVFIKAANQLPGPARVESRLEFGQNTLELIRDYPFTGGGLGSFSGQYSRYILGIPHYFIGSSHNLYLDTAVEQGVLGSLALIWILTGSLWLILSPPGSRHTPALNQAALASVLILIFFGLPDNIFSTAQSSPVLFILPGMVAALTRPAVNRRAGPPANQRILAVGTAGLILILAVLFNRQLQAAWYANLGAVHLSWMDLTNFSTGQRDGLAPVDKDEAKLLFSKAVEKDQSNPTANYRLGLLAMQQGDYPTAVNYLETAFENNPRHRGIQKALGLSYAWNDQLASASAMLRGIPEAGSEMEVYVWWWGEQGRQDLAENAGNLAARLSVER